MSTIKDSDNKPPIGQASTATARVKEGKVVSMEAFRKAQSYDRAQAAVLEEVKKLTW